MTNTQLNGADYGVLLPEGPPQPPPPKTHKVRIALISVGATLAALLALAIGLGAAFGSTSAPAKPAVSSSAPAQAAPAPVSPAPVAPAAQDAQSVLAADGYTTLYNTMAIPASLKPYVTSAGYAINDSGDAEAVFMLTPAGEAMVPAAMDQLLAGSNVTSQTSGNITRLNGSMTDFAQLGSSLGTSAA